MEWPSYWLVGRLFFYLPVFSFHGIPINYERKMVSFNASRYEF